MEHGSAWIMRIWDNFFFLFNPSNGKDQRIPGQLGATLDSHSVFAPFPTPLQPFLTVGDIMTRQGSRMPWDEPEWWKVRTRSGNTGTRIYTWVLVHLPSSQFSVSSVYLTISPSHTKKTLIHSRSPDEVYLFPYEVERANRLIQRLRMLHGFWFWTDACIGKYMTSLAPESYPADIVWRFYVTIQEFKWNTLFSYKIRR